VEGPELRHSLLDMIFDERDQACGCLRGPLDHGLGKRRHPYTTAGGRYMPHRLRSVSLISPMVA
jgi:hypothetical protein